jgi:hypothetical protein
MNHLLTWMSAHVNDKEILQVVTSLQQLDAAIAANTQAQAAETAAVNQLVSDVTNLLAKVSAAPNAQDFTSELSAVQESATAAQAATTQSAATDSQAQAVLNPPASTSAPASS